MRMWHLAATVVAGPLGFLYVAAKEPVPQVRMGSLAEETVWQKDYDAARETASRNGKPLFVVFR